jgi:hypothetical protein
VHDDLLAALRRESRNSAARAGDLGLVVVLEFLLGAFSRLERQHLRSGVDVGEFTASDLRLGLGLG